MEEKAFRIIAWRFHMRKPAIGFLLVVFAWLSFAKTAGEVLPTTDQQLEAASIIMDFRKVK